MLKKTWSIPIIWSKKILNEISVSIEDNFAKKPIKTKKETLKLPWTTIVVLKLVNPESLELLKFWEINLKLNLSS